MINNKFLIFKSLQKSIFQIKRIQISLQYFILFTTLCYLSLCFYSFKVSKAAPVSKQKYFRMSVIWAIVLTLFGVFSGIFILVAGFSLITQEWDINFLWTKTPVFVGTFISFKIFAQFKQKFNQTI